MSVVNLTGETYEDTRSTPGIVLIEWHGSGDEQAGRSEVYETLAETHDVTIGTMDAEQESTTAALAHVTDLPTLVVYRDGLEVFRSTDPLDPDDLASVLTSVRDLDMQEVKRAEAMRDADDHRGG